MLVKVLSVANVGLESVQVEAEVDVATQGFPGLTIVGLAGKSVEEARERIKTAIKNSGMDFPAKKIVINLAPSDLPKEGTAYDLPMAVGILAASGQTVPEINEEVIRKSIFYGELGLDGDVRPTRGVLLVALHAKQKGSLDIFVPIYNANEAAMVEGVNVFPVRNLGELVDHLIGTKKIEPLGHVSYLEVSDGISAEFDLAEIAGQEMAKRALIIAAAGGHNLLFRGPPGTGKTMLARAMPGILPALSAEEALEVTRVYSVAGLIDPGESIVRRRPFRSPHHGVSAVGLIGGGSNPTPGEVSLAHLGVLFLDEMAEFPRSVLEALRQPLEDGKVDIVRVAARVKYPASFTLLAAINPCPCGYLGHPTKPCRCSDLQIEKYRLRLSGPILDRIDMHVTVSVVESEKLTSEQLPVNNLNSRVVKEKVVAARKIQENRFAGRGMYTNSQMKNKQVKEWCETDMEGKRLLRLALEKYDLSARAYFKILKVARTIADLDEAEKILTSHVAEALQYRQFG